MDIRDYEILVRTDIEKVINNIIKDNMMLPISAKSRAGAEVSDFLESKFVEYTMNTHLNDSEQAPKGKTKNPWDARTFHTLKGHREEIWIDFKAFKVSSGDSNPDIGTPNKVFDFINKGGFYLLYIHIYYNETQNGLEFVKHNNTYVKSYFLKDVSHTFRRTPTNQLQVNFDAEPEYRSREEFIMLLDKKVLEGYDRQIQNATKRRLQVIANENKLLKNNSISQKFIEDLS